MATTLTDLAIVVRANASNISADISKGIRQAQGSAAAQGKALGLAVAAGFATAAAGIATAFKRGVQQIDDLSAAAQKIGASTSGLAELQLAAKLTDSSFEGLTAGIAKMTANIASGKVNDALGKLKLDAQAIRQMKPEEQFSKIAGALGQIGDKGAQLSLGKDIFGKGFVEFVNLAEAGSAKLAEMNEIANVLGLTVSDKMVGAIGEFDNATHIIAATWDGFSRQLAGELAPTMQGLSQIIVDQVKEWGGMNVVAKNVAEAVKGIAGFALDALSGVIKLYQALQLVVAQAIQVGAVILQWNTVGIANVLEGIGKMTRSLAEMVKANESEFRAMINVIIQLLSTAINAISQKVTKVVQDMTNGIRGAYNDVSSLWGGDPLAPVSLSAPKVDPVFADTTSQGASDALFTASDNIDAMAEAMGGLSTEFAAAANAAEEFKHETFESIMGPSLGEKFRARSEANANLVHETQQASQATILEMNKAADGSVKANQKALGNIKPAVADVAKSTSNAFTQIQSANRAVVTDMVSAWIGGTAKMSDVIHQWAQQSLKSMVDVLMFGTGQKGGFGGLLGGLAGGGGGGGVGGFIGSLAGSLFGIPQFADGGMMMSGRPALVGERGPEIMIPRQSGTVIPNGAGLGGGGSTIFAPVINQHFPVGVSRIELAAALDAMEERTLSGVVAAYERGGSVRRRLRS